jgi:4'-phosphopantetheinyl transferase EntD
MTATTVSRSRFSSVGIDMERLLGERRGMT